MAEAEAVVGVSRDEMQVDMDYLLPCHLTVCNYPIQSFTLQRLIHSSTDFSSRRGLIRKVNERRRLLRYLEREDKPRFDVLVDKLKLKIAKKIAAKRAEAEAERRAMEEAKLAMEAAKEAEANEVEDPSVNKE